MAEPARARPAERLPTRSELCQTAAYLVASQEPSGAMPWERGAHTDVWDHVECAMALTSMGEHDAAEAAYAWMGVTQRPDGTWPMRQVEGVVEDAGADTNQCAYLAVGVWHHWMVRADRRFVERMWPVVCRALDFAVSRQLPFGGVAWAQDAAGMPFPSAVLAGSASIWQALGRGLALAALLGEDASHWAAARDRLGSAVRERESSFQANHRFSMDWYYPVLAGVLRGPPAWERIEARWADFVVPGLGIRCVDDRPWVTGAETCELALALDALDEPDAATRLVLDMQHLRDPDGSYHTGFVYEDGLRWPIERSTWTAATVILAVDAIEEHTEGSGLFRL